MPRPAYYNRVYSKHSQNRRAGDPVESEKDFYDLMCNCFRRCGFSIFKIEPHRSSGIPDVLGISPMGDMFFAELKIWKKKDEPKTHVDIWKLLLATQKVWHRKHGQRTKYSCILVLSKDKKRAYYLHSSDVVNGGEIQEFALGSFNPGEDFAVVCSKSLGLQLVP